MAIRMSEALELVATLRVAYPTFPWTQEVVEFWARQIVDSDRSVWDAQRAVQQTISEERFLTWAAVESRMPTRLAPYDYGNQAQRVALPPPLAEDEQRLADEAKREAFSRWHEFRRTNPTQRDTVGAWFDEVVAADEREQGVSNGIEGDPED